MSNIQQTTAALFSQANVKKRFEELLGKKAPGFITSVLNVVKTNSMLSNANPTTIMSAAGVAASLDLPIDPNLGFSAIVPYKSKDGVVAQFQMMYKGYIQLALRTNQYKNIVVQPVYDGEMVKHDRFTGEYVFDESKRIKDAKIIGYVGYFKLLNGFEKYVYWTIEEIDQHGKKYSKSYSHANGLWKNDFDAMARKTIIKHMLSKWGAMSIEMNQAVTMDQAVINDDDHEYPDNPTEEATFEEVTESVEDKKKKLTRKTPDLP